MSLQNTVIVRPFLASEWSEYREIRLRALEDSPDAFGSTYAESVLFSDEQWQERLAGARPETDFPMVAISNENICGLAWTKIEHPETEIVHLYQMWVDPSYRRRGIGRALVEAGISWARQQNAEKMMLEVTSGDRPARRLYDELGFVPVGELAPVRHGSKRLEQTMELQL